VIGEDEVSKSTQGWEIYDTGVSASTSRLKEIVLLRTVLVPDDFTKLLFIIKRKSEI
jgi:hypothetical protein